MRRLVLTLGWLGTLLFGGVVLLSFAEPLRIEQAARELLRIEIEHRIGEKVESLSGGRLANLARKAVERQDGEIERMRRVIANDLPRRVAERVADLQRADCECRQRLVRAAQEAATEHLQSLLQLRERLDAMIETAYAQVTRQLLRELRIFSGSNALAFALLLGLAARRRSSGRQLMLATGVLVGAVGLTGGLYLFHQNWLHTLVFGSYVGLAYAGWLAAVAGLLGDLAFNRARVTNLVVNAVGALAGPASPC